MRMRLPRGFSVANSSLRTLLPSTTKGRAWRGSSSGRKRPTEGFICHTLGTAGPTPSTMVLRLRWPASMAALPCTTGTTSNTRGRRFKASASSMLRGRTLLTTAPDIPRVLALPGVTAIRLVPNWVNSASTKRWIPSPIEVRSITEAIPTAIPSAVRKLRMRWAHTEPMASFIKSRVSMLLLPLYAINQGVSWIIFLPGPLPDPERQRALPATPQTAARFRWQR